MTLKENKMEKDYDRHVFMRCVTKARKIITEKDIFSETARNLLSELIYDYGNVKSFNLNKLMWFDVLKDYSGWVEHRDINENMFEKIKIFLIKKVAEFEEEN